MLQPLEHLDVYMDDFIAIDAQSPRCCHRAAAVALCPAAALRAAATTADAAMLPPTSRCRAVATAGLIGGGGMTLLSSAQSIVDYSELCMGGGG